jgi:hypothetical protein
MLQTKAINSMQDSSRNRHTGIVVPLSCESIYGRVLSTNQREIDGRRIRRTVEFVVLQMAMRQEEDRLQRVSCVLSQRRG